MNELKKHTLKVRINELENRLNNLKALVDNIAFNQEQIVKAFEVDAEEVKPSEVTNQLRIDDEAKRLGCCDNIESSIYWWHCNQDSTKSLKEYDRRSSSYKACVREAISQADVIEVLVNLGRLAKQDDVAATKLFLEYTIGKPQISVAVESETSLSISMNDLVTFTQTIDVTEDE